MSKALWLLAAGLAGCMVPTMKIDTRVKVVSVTDATNSVTTPTSERQVTARVDAAMANVIVTAIELDRCERDRVAVYDETETAHIGLDLDDVNPVTFVVGALPSLALWPITFPIAAVQVHEHVDKVTRKQRVLATYAFTCPQPVAGAAVVVTFASGAVQTATTGADGLAAIAIPADEPEVGVAQVQLADQQRSVPVFRTTPACSRTRDAVFERALHTADAEPRVQLLRELPTSCGDAADHAWELLANGALAASAARCDEVRDAVQRLDASDRELGARLRHERNVAQCLNAPKQAREYTRCLAMRSAQLHQAQTIADIDERTRALTSATECVAPIRVD